MSHLLCFFEQLLQFVQVLQLGQVAWTHGVDNGVKGRSSLVNFLLRVPVIGSIHIWLYFLVLLRHAGEAVDGPWGVLRNLHRQGVPSLLFVDAGFGYEEELTKLGSPTTGKATAGRGPRVSPT